MTCGHAKKKKECLTFDKLGAKYNITTEEGARLAYQKAVENLVLQMMEDAMIRTARIKLKSKTRQKIENRRRSLHHLINVLISGHR